MEQLILAAVLLVQLHGEDAEYLVKNAFFEARNSATIEQKRNVTSVVLNRVKARLGGVTIKSVLTFKIGNRCQFSWYCDGRSDNPLRYLKDSKGHYIKKEVKSYLEAVAVALEASTGKLKDHTHGALYYHSKYVYGTDKLYLPSFFNKLTKTFDDGLHLFYR